MKSLIFLILLMLSFSQSNAQTRVQKKAKTVEKARPQLKKARTLEVISENRNVPLYEKFRLIDKKLASRFQRVQDYPSGLDRNRNGNAVKGVYKNNDGVYRIQYHANKEKEYNYYTDENAILSEYEIFELLRGVDDYKQIRESNIPPVFYEVGIKKLDGAQLLKVELNTKRVYKATYQKSDNSSIIAYSDGNNWLTDGEFTTHMH